jgi:uncharacterized protein YndB with AHSA1/START domain
MESPELQSAEETVSAVVTQAFNQSPEEVFDAWVNPEQVKRWFGTGLGEVTQVSVDPGPGGLLSITQMQEDGEVTHFGKFQQVIHPRRMIFLWTMEGDEGHDRIIVDIAPKPIGCEVTLTYEMDAEYAEFVENAELAWGVMLRSMAQMLIKDEQADEE